MLEELLGLDRGARALDPDAAAALLLTHARIPGANLFRGGYCGTWAGTYSWACPRSLAHSLNMRIRAQTQAQGRARACVMTLRTVPNVWSFMQKTEVDSRNLSGRESRTKSKDRGCVFYMLQSRKAVVHARDRTRSRGYDALLKCSCLVRLQLDR